MDPDERPGATYVLGTDTRQRERLAAEWAEPARDAGDPPLPEERPDLVTGLAVADATVPVPATYAAAFGLVRGAYLREGRPGVADLFNANGMAPRRMSAGNEYREADPEDFLPADRRVLYRLLDAARRRLERFAPERVRRVEPIAADHAILRLAAARMQIRDELRYLRGPIEGALTDGVSPTLFSLRPGEVVDGLLTELRRGRELLDRLAVANADLAAMRADVGARAARRTGPWGFAPDNAIANRAMLAAVAADPAVVAKQGVADAARLALYEHVTGAGLEYPVLFRVYRDADSDDRAGVARSIVTALRTAERANVALRTDLIDDRTLVWRFPAVIRGALTEAGVPELSVTWTAAEERLEEEQGPRLAAQVGTVTGLATGAVAVLGTAVAPPVAVVVAVADAIVNAVDALQEFLEYRRMRAGFDAVLDPALALSAEPGLLATILTIAFDLLSVAPVPGGTP